MNNVYRSRAKTVLQEFPLHDVGLFFLILKTKINNVMLVTDFLPGFG